MENTATSSAPTDTPWIAEVGKDGFSLVVNSKSVVLAEKCVEEEALLFAAAPELLEALDRLLDITLDADLGSGNELTEDEQEAREMALAAIAKATEKTPPARS